MDYRGFFVIKHPLLMVITGCLVLSSCSWLPALDEVLPDKRKEYQKSTSLPDLEIPPDLSADAIKDTLSVPDVDEGGTATYSTYQERLAARRSQKKEPVAAEPQAAPEDDDESGTEDTPTPSTVSEDGSATTLRGNRKTIWTDLQSFWKERSYDIDVDDESDGKLQTGWRENPDKGTRSRFVVSVQDGDEADTSIVTLKHEAQKQHGDDWEDHPRDKDFEGRMLAKLEESITGKAVSMVSDRELAEDRATRESAPALPEKDKTGNVVTSPEILNAGEGKKYLLLVADFADAWHETGAALERAGIKIEDKDESRGLYYIRYPSDADSEEGFLSKLAFWSEGDTSTKHRVNINTVGTKSEVVVLDHKGSWENNEHADKILDLLLANIGKSGESQ
jgi:outer membrane protein assembly factor BamC